MKAHKKGFTLIELMIVLGIVAVLLALALPSFRDVIRKSRRADGMKALLEIHLAEKRWRVNNTTYASLTQLGYSNPFISPDGHYSITVAAPVLTRATSYAITAAPVGGSDQASDSCGTFKLTFSAGTITKEATGDNDLCWKKK